jgi:hypothetical protein
MMIKIIPWVKGNWLLIPLIRHTIVDLITEEISIEEIGKQVSILTMAREKPVLENFNSENVIIKIAEVTNDSF